MTVSAHQTPTSKAQPASNAPATPSSSMANANAPPVNSTSKEFAVHAALTSVMTIFRQPACAKPASSETSTMSAQLNPQVVVEVAPTLADRLTIWFEEVAVSVQLAKGSSLILVSVSRVYSMIRIWNVGR